MITKICDRVVSRGSLRCLEVLLVIVVAFSATPAAGQVSSGKRIYDEQLRVRLDRQIPQAREIGFDAGGWFSFGYFNFDDEVGEKHRLRQYELRGWASLNIKNVHKFYFRGLVGWDDWNAGDNTTTYHGDEDTDPEVERAWYELSLAPLLGAPAGRRALTDVRFKVGRAFTEIGTGLTLSMPLDLIRFNVELLDWEFTALLGKTVDGTVNIDPSAAVATNQDRCFYGFELAYEGLDRHRPFVYYLSNSDHTDADPEDPDQSFDYSSRYLGLGSEGTLFSPNLRYQVELVGEWGKTYSEDVRFGQDDICAFAADVVLEYYFETRTRPKVMFEYLYGSGDRDRSAS